MEKRGPYYYIELSTDSEPETTGPEVPVVVGQKKTLRAKKDALIASLDEKIKKLMNVNDYGKILDELDKMVVQARKLKETVPRVFLRRIRSLDDFLKNPKDKNNQMYKRLKKKHKEIETEFEAQFAAAGDKINEEESEEETPEVVEEETQRRPKVEDVEEEEVDFSKRLKLSKDDRRKFWQVKKKDPVQKKVEAHKKVERVKTAKVKATAENINEYAGIRTDEQGVRNRLKEIGADKNFMKFEEKEKAAGILEYLSGEVKGPRLAETLMLLISLKLDIISDSDFVTVEDAKDLIHDFKDLLKVGVGQTLNAYSRNEDREIGPEEVLSRISKLLLLFDGEHQTVVGITDPFSEDYAKLLIQEIEILELMKRVRKLAEGSKKTQAFVALRELRHIHAWRNEILLCSERLTELVDYGQIEKRAEELLEFVSAGADEAEISLARLFYAHCLALNEQQPELVRKLLFSAHKATGLFTEKYNVGVYNRAVGHLGLCLFNRGQFADAKAALEHLLASENLTDQLCQFDAFVVKAWEFSDPSSLLPAHLHLNVAKLDSVFLLLCVLTESHSALTHKPQFSERFARFIDLNSKNLFLNTSVDLKDKLFAAFNRLKNFDVSGTLQALGEEFSEDPELSAKLEKAVQLEAARCFAEKLTTLSKTSMDLKQMSEDFSLPLEELTVMVQNKIDDHELKASLSNNILKVDAQSNSSADVSLELVEKLNIFSKILSAAEVATKASKDQKSNAIFDISQLLQTNFERKEKPLNFQIANEISKSKSAAFNINYIR